MLFLDKRIRSRSKAIHGLKNKIKVSFLNQVKVNAVQKSPFCWNDVMR